MVGVPRELSEQRRWVCWRWDVDAKGNPTKVPTNPHGSHARGNASSTNPGTWTTYEHATRKATEWNLPGVGFVFTGSDLVGVDLDHVRNPETGETEAWALHVIRHLDSYTELSQSGTGYHIIARGILPPEGRKRGPIEMYDASSPRYFCTTGQHVPGTPETVNERTAQLSAVHARYFPPKERKQSTTIARTETPTLPDDTRLLEMARNARNGAKFRRLFDDGDWTGYPSQSEADSALCMMLAFWTGKDAARIDRLFRHSGLYRDKWDEQRGALTYGEGTIAEAMDLQGETYTPGGTASAPPEEPDWMREQPPRRHFTDLGNAERLIDRFGADLHYCEPLGGWLVWDGKRWQPNAVGQVQRMAHQVARNLYAEAGKLYARAETETDQEKRKATVASAESAGKHAAATESATRQRAMLDLAWALEGVAVLPDAWDADPWLLNVNNGTVDLRTGELRPHDRADMLTKLAPVDYDPSADAPTWRAHLERFLPEADVRRQVQRTLGVALVGDVLEEALDIWHGTGANGKTTTERAIESILGEYAQNAAPNLLIASRYDNHPTELADLRGSRLVFDAEIGDARTLDEAKVKKLTGGEPITARFMRQDFFRFARTFSLVMLVNHLPNISGADDGIWRRIRLIPWRVRIPEAEQRPQSEIVPALVAEGPGILRWMLEGLADWQRQPRWTADAVTEATESYKAEQDRLGAFLADCCEMGPHYTASVAELYEAYTDWCTESGQEAIGKQQAGKLLRQRGITQQRDATTHTRARRWIGLRLRTKSDSFSVTPHEEAKTKNDVKTCPTLSDSLRVEELMATGLSRDQAELMAAYEAETDTEQAEIPF